MHYLCSNNSDRISSWWWRCFFPGPITSANFICATCYISVDASTLQCSNLRDSDFPLMCIKCLLMFKHCFAHLIIIFTCLCCRFRCSFNCIHVCLSGIISITYLLIKRAAYGRNVTDEETLLHWGGSKRLQDVTAELRRYRIPLALISLPARRSA